MTSKRQYTCIERRHQDGSWHLAFSNIFLQDPALGLPHDPPTHALTYLSENKPLLAWLMTHTLMDQADEAVKTARIRLEQKMPMDGDTILGALDHTESFFHKGLPSPAPDWLTTPRFAIPTWHWIHGKDIFSSRFNDFDYLDLIADWRSTLKVVLDTWSQLDTPFQMAWAPTGTGLATLDTSQPYSGLSAHQRLAGIQQGHALLPPTPDTIRVLIGFI